MRLVVSDMDIRARHLTRYDTYILVRSMYYCTIRIKLWAYGMNTTSLDREIVVQLINPHSDIPGNLQVQKEVLRTVCN